MIPEETLWSGTVGAIISPGVPFNTARIDCSFYVLSRLSWSKHCTRTARETYGSKCQ